MTPEAQRIAIAEACGWKWISSPANYSEPMYSLFPPKPDEYEVLINRFQFRAGKHGKPENIFAHNVPNYPADLNAMHEAEKVLDDGVLWKGYLNRLWDVTCPQFEQMSGLNAAVGLLLVHATAAQRAEAFLRTIGKWNDSL